MMTSGLALRLRAVRGGVGGATMHRVSRLAFWRRSVTARVVASTLILSALVIGGVGWFLLHQTRNGLLDHRVDAVVAEAADESYAARSQLAAATGTEVDAVGQEHAVAGDLITRGEARGFSVIVSGPRGQGLPASERYDELTPGLELAASVPASLERRFEDVGAGPAWTYTSIVTRPAGSTAAAGPVTSTPGVIVASQITLPADGSTDTVYFLFPLTDQQETLSLVTRALLAAGVLFLVLVAALTWVITRQVVTPVRMARQVAERLAAGRLQERMVVRGEDDLARLATSFNQMASNLQGQIRRLQELSAVQRRFASDVSHELRTPLTTVRLASEVIAQAAAELDPVTRRSAELLSSELDRFEDLLTDLLEISRIDAGVAHLEPTRLDLREVARRVADATRAVAEHRGVTVLVEAPGPSTVVEADPRRVERIVRNLVTNAIDHADPDGNGPSVVIRFGGDADAVALVVRDYGVGLQAGESAMVFNRFWRGDPSRARTSGGTGLGLSISLEDTRLHGGWLQAWGRPGEGAQFRLTLPRRSGARLRRSPLPLEPPDVAPTTAGPAAVRATGGAPDGADRDGPDGANGPDGADGPPDANGPDGGRGPGAGGGARTAGVPDGERGGVHPTDRVPTSGKGRR